MAYGKITGLTILFAGMAMVASQDDGNATFTVGRLLAPGVYRLEAFGDAGGRRITQASSSARQSSNISREHMVPAVFGQDGRLRPVESTSISTSTANLRLLADVASASLRCNERL